MKKVTSTELGKLALGALLVLGAFAPARADETQISPHAVVEITTSKLPKPAELTPGMLTVISGQDLLARNAKDLRSALSLVAGVDIAPGGDAGPAASVPGMWGLREFDAFLLVVDGIPRGGVFNPALATLSMANVERIEVQRGAAPVMFGATSFVGVIHVVHADAGKAGNLASFAIGNHHSANLSVVADLAKTGPMNQSLYLDLNKQGFTQDDSGTKRAHMLYRGLADTDLGKLRLDLDVTLLKQNPYSPHPREANVMSTRFPLDANVNPSDARADENRIELTVGLDRQLGFANWSSVLSLGHARNNNTRGFLREDFADDGVTHNADGFRQTISTDYLYFDTHLNGRWSDQLGWTAGLDCQYGKGTQNSANVEYGVLPNGANRPDSTSLEVDETTRLSDRRNFAGVYGQLEWQPLPDWTVVAGLRYNATRESRAGAAVDNHAEPGDVPFSSSDRRSKNGLTGSLAASYTLWTRGADRMTAFANYRDTFKPAAIDFGPEAEGAILRPETARSVEAGLKGKLLDARLDWEMSVFRMNFANLVIRENIDGLPGLANAGTELFKGFEAEGGYRVCDDLRVSASWAYHDARFRDYARLRPDDTIQQLGGKRLELSPQNIGALGAVYAPRSGLQASLVWSRVGSRFLNKGNTSVAAPYNLVDAGLGWRLSKWSVRLDGYNLGDARAPVAESELGDAQFYRLPGRSVMLSATTGF